MADPVWLLDKASVDGDHPDNDRCDRCRYRRFEHPTDVDDEPHLDFIGNPVPCWDFLPVGPPDAPTPQLRVELDVPICRCGHTATVHEHYSWHEHCSMCSCRQFKRVRRSLRQWWADWRTCPRTRAPF